MPATAGEIDSLFAEAAKVTAVGSKSFYFATRFFPTELARHAHAVYWFCRTTDDLVDEAPDLATGRAQLDAWEAEFHAPNPVTPAMRLFRHVAETCGIPDEYPLDLIRGCRMDLERQRYQTFTELEVFCYRVASTVGLMMCHVIGFTSEADPALAKRRATELGIAMQLTNILRDVGADWKLGRVYFPQEDLARFGVSEEQLAQGERTEGFRALMRFEAERAREYYQRALPGIVYLRPQGRFAVEIAAKVYERILGRIEANDYDVFSKRAVVSNVTKYGITLRAIATSRIHSMNWKQITQESSLAALVGLAFHYPIGYLAKFPFLTDVIAEWIMARTPSAWAVPLLERMGEWAKPFASTGGLATLGLLLFLVALASRPWARAALLAALGAGLAWSIEYTSWLGAVTFLVPALLFLTRPRVPERAVSKRREFLTSAAMLSGTGIVALEALIRNRALAASAVEPVPLFRYAVPAERLEWGKGLVRKPVTPLREFYVMSKNTVDPVVDPKTWRLKIKFDDRVIREFSYAELLSLPREERFVTLRCVSNTLKSDLMGTAAWTGIRLEQLVRAGEVPKMAVEMAVIGLDGHGDSYQIPYAFSGEPLLALGMNGETLNRNHGFPIRLLTPRYFGFKSIKWLDEIRFTSTPYFGTWPKQGYTKEPLIHTASYIDKIARDGAKARVGGVSFAGVRGVQRVEVRADGGIWVPVEMEPSLSPYTLTRWKGELELPNGAQMLEARALDGTGKWQATVEKPLFPDGVSGPTVRRIPSA
jgi:phytoene synthase